MYNINSRYHNAEIRLAYEYWCSRAGARRIPARADIDPVEMRPWIAATLLADAVFDTHGAPVDFFFRVAGTQVCARYGRELTHRYLSDIPMDGQKESVLANYRAVIETCQPFYSINRIRDETGLQRSFEMLLLPLSAAGDGCDMVLGVVLPLPRDYDAEEGVWIYQA
jgi:hypothetical protein